MATTKLILTHDVPQLGHARAGGPGPTLPANRLFFGVS